MTEPNADFWSRVNKTDGCWLWTGSLNPEGYGNFSYQNKLFKAHRWSYMEEFGPIPDGLVLDHLCRIPACVRPSHLEAVTNRENLLRGVGLTAKHAQATHCPQGHPYDEANTYVNPAGKRNCRICLRANSVRYKLNRRAHV